MADAAKSIDPPLVPRQVVHIVEDDEQFRLSLLDLFQSLDIEAEAFEDAASFFERASKAVSGCVLLDVRLPGVNGIEFQAKLSANGFDLPVVFMTAHGDVATSVTAMKAGAVDFLQKPLRTTDLLDAIEAAFSLDRDQQQERSHRMEVRSRADTLTRRETQIFALVASGLMNKQIAFELGISEIMVKLHRGSVMRKMRAKSLADLVRQYELIS
ncbi:MULTISPECIES: response regulator transcription factor [Rhizobium]|uniref:response regulator transcription factor n=1 Tax=Rhizobium TaxID=379 RepID=UPI00049041EF|nr:MULTISPECIES: response regulator [Rhizobium]MBY3130183.1 response regulator transcription factor [Rhizobium laguerreae]MBY5779394.1 response regulator transcription factor [Rhizobium leguminosarum]MBY5827505.1 response regulator transcription factor [Rhizobium leguminosarum]NEH46004.1 response regulator [Rhizobium leguminosarum]NKM65102.1 response regulator [Rhizobium leguminosarum bv. viciae]